LCHRRMGSDMTSEDVKLAISVGVPSLTVLAGILINNSRLSDLRMSLSETRSSLDQRFDDLIRLIDARFDGQDQKLYRVEQVIDARLKHLEQRLG
jgi:hypothetical protein